MNNQLSIFPEGVTDAEVLQLRAWLATHGWQTRRELVAGLGWDERKIRTTLELMGADVVRGQRGFKLTELLTREEIGLGLQAADAFESQAAKNQAYAYELRKRLHAVVG